MRSELSATSSVFEANRARGAVRFDVHARDGVTRRGALHESGSLRVRFPSPEDEGLSGVFVNTAGGIAGGDRFDIEISVADAARLSLTTAAAEKVYRAPGAAAQLNICLKAAAGAHLGWLPQETILFDRCVVRRRLQVELAESARFLGIESLVFGRAAMGEVVDRGSLNDTIELRRGGRLLLRDSIRLEGNVAAMLGRKAIADRARAVATVVYVAPDTEAMLEALRCLRIGASAWDGMLIARMLGADGAALRASAISVLQVLRGGRALPRVWQC
jgi:urease accessory protein